MEQLRDITLLTTEYVSLNLAQLLLITLATLGVLALGWLLLSRFLPWYYGKEAISEKNKGRVRRVVRFTLISTLVIAILRILDIDFTFFDGTIQRSPTDDGSPTYLVVRISTLVKAIIAFIVANVLDLVIEEFLVQRYHRLQRQQNFNAQFEEDHRGVSDRFRAVQPVMYTLALIFVATDTGLSRYWLLRYGDGENISTVTVANVLTALLVFFIIRLVLLISTTLVLNRYYRSSNIDRGSQYAINRLLTYFVYIIGGLLALQAAGVELSLVWGGAAALLVGIGIGLQQTFNDLICGVIILFERSVMVGDVVELQGHQVGTVRKIGTRTSTVETRDDIIIFVPNSKLIGENVTNWSHVERKARFHVAVGVAYGSDTALVKRILMEVAEEHERILEAPQPIVRFLDFGSSSLDFDVIFWARDFLRIEDVKSDVRFAIDRKFREHGVEIPFPQRDLWVRGGAGLERFGPGGGGPQRDAEGTQRDTEAE